MILVGAVIELAVLAWQAAPWLDVAAVVGAVVVIAVIALIRRSKTPNYSAAVSSPVRVYGGPELASPKQPRICAICGAQGRNTSRVSRPDGSLSIRVCATCAEGIRSADPELSAKAMHMPNEPLR